MPGSDAYINAMSGVRRAVQESHMAPYYKRPRVSDQEVVLIKDEDYEETVVKEVRGVDEGSVDSDSHTTGY